MNETIKLKSAKQVDHAIECVKKALAEPNLHEVIIKEHRNDQSLAQLRLEHMWYKEISDVTGETPEDVKIRMKGKFLIDIYIRDEVDEYGRTVETLRDVYRAGAKKDAMYLHRQMVRAASTADANKKQKVEYLNLLEMDAAQSGIQLTRPSDYGLAVGVE